MNLHLTTPFGRRSLTAAQIHAQANAAGCPQQTTVNKWSVFRDIAAARSVLGLSDRALAVLDALLTFHPETALTAGPGCELVVFPSNAALALRAHGMAEPSLRRHLAALVEAGIVIRRDSPNGKRYVRREPGGAVTQAFGFDVTPLVARAAEFAAHAETVRAAALALRVARERVTLLRRDCAKLILALDEAAGSGSAVEPLRDRYRIVVGTLPRVPTAADLEAAAEALARLSADLSKLLLIHSEPPEMSGTGAQDERHRQSSKPDAHDSRKASGERMKEPAAREDAGVTPPQPQPAARHEAHPLNLVLEACPDIAAFARDGIRSWRDLGDAADLVRSALGISPDAWHEARAVMGPDAAAATVAAILQRCEHVKNPGGYLRSLVERKRAGTYSLAPVLQALMRARLKVREHRRPAAVA